MNEFVDKKKSIVKQIKDSHVVKDIYTANRDKCTEPVKLSRAIRDFAWNPQHYDSEAQVLCRLVLTFDATMCTAAQVVHLRGATSEEGAANLVMLQRADAEMCLQLGMMADGALETRSIVEIADKDDVDEAEFPDELERYNAVMHKMFIEGMVMYTPGCTQVMLQTLLTPRTFLLQGVAHTLGSTDGVPADVVRRCLARMAAWSMMAKSIIVAEFPNYELMASLNAFTLSATTRSRKTATVSGSQHKMLTKLGQSLELPTEDVIAEFHHFEPIARACMKRMSCGTVEAWKRATQVRKTCLMSAEMLKKCLARLAAWSSSSSDVERGFVITSSLKKGKSEDPHIRAEEDVVVLRSDSKDDNVEDIINRAGKLWLGNYGRPRKTRDYRRHAGAPGSGSQAPKDTGEAAFKRARHMASDMLRGKAGRELPKTTAFGPEVLSESHLREIAFNEKKGQTYKVESFLQGRLLPEEVTPGLVDDALNHVERIGKAQHRLHLEKARKRKSVDKPVQDIAGQLVYLGKGCKDVAIASGLGVRKVDDRATADIFLVQDPANMPTAIQFTAGLTGGVVATPRYVTSSCKKGAAIAFCCATAIKRRIYVSEGFMQLHERICADMVSVMSQLDCKWVMLESADAVMEYLGGPGSVRNNRQREVLVFLSQAELDAEDFSHR